MHWIYLSPHLDDAVLSCGGMIWEQARRGNQVEVWTICAGDPPADRPLTPLAQELHARWGVGVEASAIRRAEDELACWRVGASFGHFDYLDCIYRRLPDSDEPVIQRNEDLFAPLHPGEAYLVKSLAELLDALAPVDVRLVSPLALGGHRDHRMLRQAAEGLGRPLWYYADYPYAAQAGNAPDGETRAGLRPFTLPLSWRGVVNWQKAVCAYRSQISTFWQGEAAMISAVGQYARSNGARLYTRTSAGESD